MDGQCPYDAGEAAIAWIGAMMKSFNISPVFDPSTPTVISSLKNYLNGQRKDVMLNMMTQAWGHVTKQNEEIKKLKQSNQQLTENLTLVQQNVITLQADVVKCKDEQIQQITSVVSESVKGSLKEFKSYSQAVQDKAKEVQPIINPTTLQKVVKTVVQEEDRATNVMIFGLEESESESTDLMEKVHDIFVELGEKPKIDASRIGKVKADSPRPVKVKFRNGADVIRILRKAPKLRNSAHYKRVFVTADRSVEERAEHKILVAELKKKSAEDPEGSYFIKDGQIVERERGGEFGLLFGANS